MLRGGVVKRGSGEAPDAEILVLNK